MRLLTLNGREEEARVNRHGACSTSAGCPWFASIRAATMTSAANVLGVRFHMRAGL